MKHFELAIALMILGGLALASPTPRHMDNKSAQAQTEQTAKEAVDPVCSMKVDPKRAEKSVYKGKTYYFCSKEDKDAFDKSPQKYVKK